MDRDEHRSRMQERLAVLAIYDGNDIKARRFYAVDQGWHSILDDLVRAYGEIEGAGFLRAGTKWAALKIDAVIPESAREAVAAVDAAANHRAQHTCEICGRPGDVRKRGWWKVLCDEHVDFRSTTEQLRARFPSFIDADSKVLIRGSWAKFPWLFLEQVEAMELTGKLAGTRIRLHDVYERGGEIVIDHDTIPPTVDGQMTASDPRVLLRIRHIAEEIALESKLERK